MKQKDGKTIEQLKWLYGANRSSNRSIVLLSIMNIVLAVFSVVNILIMKSAIDNASAQQGEAFISDILLFLCLMVIQIALQAWTQYMGERTSALMVNHLREYCFRHVLHGRLNDLNNYHSGAVMGRLMGDTREVSSQILAIVPGAIGSVSRLLLCLLVLTGISPTMAVIAVCGSVIFFVVSKFWRRALKKTSREIRQAEDQLQMFFKEAVENISMIRSFVLEPKMEGEGHSRLELCREKRMRRATMSVACHTGFNTAIRLIYVLCFVWCGIEIVNNRMGFGTLTAVLQLVSQVQSPISSISGYIPKYYTLLVATERIREMVDLPQEPPVTQENLGAFQSLHCEDVSFGYKKDHIIRYHPVTIRKGDCLAIRDQSGAGKSTFFKLLLHFYQPEEGSQLEVTFEDGCRKPISVNTRKLFGYVPQDNLVISGTIAENVGAVDGGAVDMARVKFACEMACADGFIQALPNQYQQTVGERGLGLSEGQVQRLAIARAVYADHPILLLDEATSALDEATEHNIIMNLKQKTDKTLVLISHRKTSISLCDTALDIVAS